MQSIKLRFTFSHRNLNSFSASWLAQNATCVRLKKRCFKDFEIWPLTFYIWPWNLIFEIFNTYFKAKVQNSKHLIYRFFNRTKFAIWCSQGAENELKVQFQPSTCVSLKKRCFWDFWIWTLTSEIWFKNFKRQSSRWGTKVKGQISKTLKNRFFNLKEVAFWASQETEDEFKVRWENGNLRFIGFF